MQAVSFAFTRSDKLNEKSNAISDSCEWYNTHHTKQKNKVTQLQISEKANNTHCDPMNATSNQNARPCTCPDCCMSNVSGMMMSCKSDSKAVVKSIEYFCVSDIQTRVSNVSCARLSNNFQTDQNLNLAKEEKNEEWISLHGNHLRTTEHNVQ